MKYIITRMGSAKFVLGQVVPADEFHAEVLRVMRRGGVPPQGNVVEEPASTPDKRKEESQQ